MEEVKTGRLPTARELTAARKAQATIGQAAQTNAPVANPPSVPATKSNDAKLVAEYGDNYAAR